MSFPNHGNIMNKYFKRGIAGAAWYNETRDQVSYVFGDDTDLFCDFLAATSPNTTVKANVTLAMKAYSQYMRGQAFNGFMGVIKNMLNIAVRNDSLIHPVRMGGDKVHNFAKALKGDLSAVVVDRWMLRAFGYDPKKGTTPKKYRDISAWITDKAKREGMQPAEVQAAIWCGIKSMDERFTDTRKIDDFLPFEVTA